MNTTEAGELLRTRRNLTGGTYNDDTITAWHEALQPWTYEQCHDALVIACRGERKVTVAHLVEHLPQQQRTRRDDRHSASCLCAGRGWIESERTGSRGNIYLAWDRCPNGPPTGFNEID
jgi:hypothetical protein